MSRLHRYIQQGENVPVVQIWMHYQTCIRVQNALTLQRVKQRVKLSICDIYELRDDEAFGTAPLAGLGLRLSCDVKIINL